MFTHDRKVHDDRKGKVEVPEGERLKDKKTGRLQRSKYIIMNVQEFLDMTIRLVWKTERRKKHETELCINLY